MTKTVELIEDILPHVSRDGGTLKVSEEAIAARAQAHGTTLDQIKDSQRIAEVITGEVVHAIGHKGVDVFGEDKDIKEFESRFDVGHLTSNCRILRNHEVYMDPRDHSKGKRSVMGYVEVTTTAYKDKGNRKAIRESVSGYASTVLS